MDKIILLKKLGFTEYEARAYLSLARLGPSVVRSIVDDSKLPRNKTYEALQKLEEKNKIVSLPVSPKKYKIINPDLLKEDFEEMSSSVDSLINLIEQPKSEDFNDLFWVLRGKKVLMDKFAIENSKCSKEIFSCSVLNKIPYKNIRVISEKVKEGVSVRFITSWDERNIRVYDAWIKAGVEIRIYDSEKFGSLPRLTVLDKSKARLTIGFPEITNESDYLTFWTESLTFSNMIRNQFLHLWDNSKPISSFFK